MKLRTRLHLAALAVVAFAGSAQGAGVLTETVDNCATLLGSLATELRYARALPPGARGSFVCPREREARAAIGASRDRVLRALGTPDATGSDDSGATIWTYRFASRFEDPRRRGGGYPVLSFHFDAGQQVNLLDCNHDK